MYRKPASILPRAWKVSVLSVTLASVIGVPLSGCTTASENVKKDYKTTSDLAVNDANKGAVMHKMGSSSFIRDSGFYVDKTPIAVTPLDPSQELPPLFLQNAKMNEQTPTPLTVITANLAKMFKVPVSIQADVLDGEAGRVGSVVGNPGSSGSYSEGASGANASAPQQQAQMPQMLSTTFGGGASKATTVETKAAGPMINDIYYDGNLEGLCDMIATKAGVSWRWDGNRILFFKYETRVFHLDALAGVAKLTAELNTTTSNSSESSGGGTSTQSTTNQLGTSGQSTSVHSTSSIWEEVSSTLQSMLSGSGHLSVAPSAGIITVKDTPEILRQVGVEVAELNKIYSKQVVLNVDVYSVQNQNGDNYAINWDLVWKTAASKYGFSYATTSASSSSTSSSGNNTFTITNNQSTSPWAGSNAIINALSTVGKTSLLTSGTVISLNGQTVPLNVSTEEAYLQSYSTSVTGTSGTATTTLTPGVVSEGFSMNFTPRVTDGNNIMMRYAIDMSSIDNITTFTAPNDTAVIQLPQVSVRDFMQNVNLRSGQTLVLTGFQQVQATDNSSGVGSAQAWWAGGSKAATALNRTIVILVTPYITR